MAHVQFGSPISSSSSLLYCLCLNEGNSNNICDVFFSAQINTCLKTNSDIGLPFFQGYTGSAGNPSRRIQSEHQAIIPSYQLSCCGNITAWGLDVNPADSSANFDIDFQVWRPSPTVNETGCYSLVGNYIVRSFIINGTPQANHVARVTPSPQDQLQFQPGDVLGFYVESHGTSSDFDNGVVMLNNGSHTNELVHFASIDVTSQPPQSGSCPYPVGSNGILNSTTRAAPVISISTTMYDCSILSTSTRSRSGSPIQPTPPAQPPSPSQPSDSSSTSETSCPDAAQSSAQSCISPILVVEIAVPLVLMFGVVILVGIIVIIVLYVKIRKLRNTTNPSLGSVKHIETYWPNNERRFTQSEEHYDSIDSTHLILAKHNVAYAISSRSGTMEKQSDVINNPVNHRRMVVQ